MEGIVKEWYEGARLVVVEWSEIASTMSRFIRKRVGGEKNGVGSSRYHDAPKTNLRIKKNCAPYTSLHT